jgi:uncharacterized protein (TIGR02145 family)
VAGYRSHHENGTVDYAGSNGSYWSSSVDGSGARYLLFYSGYAGMHHSDRADGFSVRCIQD